MHEGFGGEPGAIKVGPGFDNPFRRYHSPANKCRREKE